MRGASGLWGAEGPGWGGLRAHLHASLLMCPCVSVGPCPRSHVAACRKGKLHAALTYLQKALKLESRLENVENPADTHLNLCAVLSQIGRHAQALEHVQTALILLQEEIFAPVAGAPPGEEELRGKADRLAVLAIAYHNIGVEQEFLSKYSATLQSYRKGVEVARKYLGDDHGITTTLRNSFLSARRALAKRGAAVRGGRSPTATSPPRAGKQRGAKHAASGRVSADAEDRWNTISGAYGDPDGVEPVRRSGARRGAQRATPVGSAEPQGGPAAAATGGAAGAAHPLEDLISPRQQEQEQQQQQHGAV